MVRLDELLASLSAAAVRAQLQADATAANVARRMGSDPILARLPVARINLDSIELRIPAAVAPFGSAIAAGGDTLTQTITAELMKLAADMPGHTVLSALFRGSRSLVEAFHAAGDWLETAIGELLKAPPINRDGLIEQIAALFLRAPGQAPPAPSIWGDLFAWFRRKPAFKPAPEHVQALKQSIGNALDTAVSRTPVQSAAALAAGASSPGTALPPSFGLVINADEVAAVAPSALVTLTVLVKPGQSISALIEQADRNAALAPRPSPAPQTPPPVPGRG